MRRSEQATAVPRMIAAAAPRRSEQATAVPRMIAAAAQRRRTGHMLPESGTLLPKHWRI